ncbi:MAG: geranylgeranyl reductase family protein [Bacteroidetes bacterium]|nr:geranylgeranyl reductase family protein [Bacteroidota bacterium]
MHRKSDVIIVGAGPAGVSTAFCLGNSGLEVTLIDKAVFPREKICGDGLTLDVINQLALISDELAASFRDFSGKLPCYSAEIFSPDHRQFSVAVRPQQEERPMYTCRRSGFDYFLIQQLKQFGNVSIFENCHPHSLGIQEEKVLLEAGEDTFEAKIIIGADGVNSFVARELGVTRITKEHQCVALRTYYKGIQPLREGSLIEMYLPEEILPGYLWIFHLGDGSANVGVGMPATVINSKKINLKQCFEGLLMTEPLKSRLEGALRQEAVQGYTIPFGGLRREISGNRFLLAGDAASLVDPITGEGVGNAIRSGRVAAMHIIKCFKADDFSGMFNKAYEAEIYRRMMPEFRFHLKLRSLLNHPSLLNYIIGSAADYPSVERSLQRLIWNLNVNKLGPRIRLVFNLITIFTLQRLFASVFGLKRKRA